MAFWSAERITHEEKASPIVSPFEDKHVDCNAYALGVARQYAVTASDGSGGRIINVPEGQHITIPPGQFALLMTDERVAIPAKAMAFISVKAQYKLRGLVNVSGFHADPGFRGRLKFSVYNAGSRDLDISPNNRVFLIWFCDLDQPTERVYGGRHQDQFEITDEDVQTIRGMVASPAGLSARLDGLEQKLTTELERLQQRVAGNINEALVPLRADLARLGANWGWVRALMIAMVAAVLGIIVKLCLDTYSAKSQPTIQETVKTPTAAPSSPPLSSPATESSNSAKSQPTIQETVKTPTAAPSSPPLSSPATESSKSTPKSR